MPKLVISLPDAGEVIHELTESKLTVGRTEENTIHLDDPSVSTHHAELTLRGKDYVVKDLDSTNGTRLNGEPLVGEKKLQVGDRVCFGKVEAIYESAEYQEVLPPPQEGMAAATPAASSQRPEGFGNASPFQSKRAAKDPVNKIAIAAAVLAILAFGASIYYVQQLQPPVF